MKTEALLNQVYEGQMTAEEAYNMMHPLFDKKKLKRARFVKFRIRLPNESRKLNIFLRVLFGLPVPICLVRFALRFVNEEKMKSFSSEQDVITLDRATLRKLITYSKGTRINVDSDDARIIIKIV